MLTRCIIAVYTESIDNSSERVVSFLPRNLRSKRLPKVINQIALQPRELLSFLELQASELHDHAECMRETIEIVDMQMSIDIVTANVA